MHVRLRYEMLKRNLTGKEICMKTGMRLGTFYPKLRGERKFSVPEAIKIKEAMGCTIPIEILFEET